MSTTPPELLSSIYANTPIMKGVDGAFTYGQLVDENDLIILTEETFPGTYSQLNNMSAEQIKNAANEIRKNKIDRYRVAPIPFSEQLIFPQYFERKRRAEEGVLSFAPKIGVQSDTATAMFDRSSFPPMNDPDALAKPVGYDNVINMFARGVDSRNTFNDASLRSAVAYFTGLNPSPDDLNFMFDNFQIPGTKKGYRDQYPDAVASYIDPTRPETGIRIDNVQYDDKGKSIPLVYDSPAVTASDFGEFFVEETLPITGEIGTAYAMARKGKFNEYLKRAPSNKGFLGKVGDSIAFNSILSAVGAGTRFKQRALGYALGAHNKSAPELLEETGMYFLYSYLGNQGMDVLMQGVPKIWRTITGKDISASDLREIEIAFENKLKSEAGKRVDLPLGEKEPFTVQEIREAAEELGVEIFYKPSLARASRSEWVQRLQQSLLSKSNQKNIATVIDELVKNDAKFTKEFFSAMFKDLDENITAVSVGPEIRALLDDGEEAFIEQGRTMFDEFRAVIDDVKSGNVENLKVLDEKASNSLIERTNNRVAVLRNQYLDTTSQNVEQSFVEAGIDNTPITSRLLSTALKQFKNKGTKITEKGGPYDAKINREEYYETYRDLIPDEELFTKWSNNENLTLLDLVNLRKATGQAYSNAKGVGVAADLANLQSTIDDQLKTSINGLVKNKTITTAQKNTIIDNLVTANRVYQDANTKAVIDLTKLESPEQVLSYIASTQRKGIQTNAQMKQVVEFLQEIGDTETVDLLRNTLADELGILLDNPGNMLSGDDLAKNYKKFIDDFGPTMKELINEVDLPKLIKNPDEYANQILKPLEELRRGRKMFAERFGNKSTFNLITDIVGQSAEQRLSGKTIDDLEFLSNLIDNNEPLKREVANAYKLYIKGMLQDQNGNLNVGAFRKLLSDGHIFSGLGTEAGRLSAENFHKKLLGEGGEEFTRNLRILEDLIVRSEGVMAVYGDFAGGGRLLGEDAIRRQMIEESTDPGINYLKRFFIPPLTQTGRRITAGEKLNTEKTLNFLAELTTNQQLLDSFLSALRARNKIIPFLKVLNQVDSRLADDIEAGLSFYDKEDKEFTEEPDISLSRQQFIPKVINPENSRILQILNEVSP